MGRKSWLGALALSVALAGAALAENAPVNTFSGAYLAGQSALASGDLPAAIAYFKRALSFSPDDLEIRQGLLVALLSTGEFDEALPIAESLKTTAEIERFSRVALGADAIRRGAWQDAETLLKLALESDLDRLVTTLLSAWAQQGAGDAKAAIARIEKLEGPEWFALFKRFHMALIAEASGDAAAAKENYNIAASDLGAGSGAPDTYLRIIEARARFLARNADRDGALAAIDKSAEFAPLAPGLISLRAAIEAGTPVEPMAASPAAGAGEVLLDIGAALNRSGGEEFVSIYLQMARALAPDNEIVLIQLAEAAERLQDAESAILYYGKVPAASPYKRAADLQMALNLADLERHDEAVASLQALIDAKPEDMRAYLALGGVLGAKEDYAGAAKVYDAAIALLPAPSKQDWNLFYQRGIAFERTKIWPKAEADFKKALELFPDQPQVLNYLGYSWVDQGINLEEGLGMIRKAVELRPDDGFIVDSLGWAYFKLGRYEEAVTEMERAVALKPEDPVLNDHLGDTYWRAGRKLEATFQWAHARDLKPEPDVLAQIEKKLKQGLPDEPGKATAGPKPGATKG